MAPRPIIVDVTKSLDTKNSKEHEEFLAMMQISAAEHKEKTVKLLNQLFENDPTNDEAAILIRNNSDCNLIMRLQGEKYYNLAVPAHGENTLVIKQGDYIFSSDVCGIKYQKNKTIAKNILVVLNKENTSGS